MELLLNILWLMLVLPAFLVLRHHSASARSSGRASHPGSLVLLGCLLALLFPIVSASDDLHAASIEMEEASVSKRAVKQSPSAKSPAWSDNGGRPMRLVHVAALHSKNEACGTVSEYLPVLPELAVACIVHDRAPPEV